MCKISASLVNDLNDYKLSFSFVALWGIAFFLFFWLIGWYFTSIAGEHSGDEGHYIIQAETLYLDHDLDILNNFDEKERWMLARQGKNMLHISPASRNNHYYSWHPFGLPFLMAPSVPYGVGGRHLVLGLLAGVGCAGMLLLCGLMGVSKIPSIVLTSLFCFSSYWGVFACRALPEIGGASLTIWMMISIVWQKKYPKISLWLITCCCLFLPWLQSRFIPVSITGATLYVLFNLFIAMSRKQRIQRLMVLALGLLAGGLIYVWFYFGKFENGTAYPVSNLLFSYPFGMVEILIGSKSVTYIFPLFAFLLTSTLYVLIHDSKNRFTALATLLLVSAVLVTSCATCWWDGGATMPGRFLLVVAPLLVPFGALVYERATIIVRCFCMFLGLISCVSFVLILLNLSLVGNYFTDPQFALSWFLPLYFKGLYNFFLTPFNWYGLVFYCIVLLLIFSSSRDWKWFHSGLIFLLLGATGFGAYF